MLGTMKDTKDTLYMNHGVVAAWKGEALKERKICI